MHHEWEYTYLCLLSSSVCSTNAHETATHDWVLRDIPLQIQAINYVYVNITLSRYVRSTLLMRFGCGHVTDIAWGVKWGNAGGFSFSLEIWNIIGTSGAPNVHQSVECQSGLTGRSRNGYILCIIMERLFLHFDEPTCATSEPPTVLQPPKNMRTLHGWIHIHHTYMVAHSPISHNSHNPDTV